MLKLQSYAESRYKKTEGQVDCFEAEAEGEKKRAVEAARERVLKDFERIHFGLSAKSVTSTPTQGSPLSTESSRLPFPSRPLEYVHPIV